MPVTASVMMLELRLTIVFNFILIHSAPGDPVSYMMQQYAATPEYVALIGTSYGLDKPLYEQLFIYLTKVLTGDLGYSFSYHQPVANLILSRIPATLLLVGTALVISTIVGIIAGVVSSTKPYSATDSLISTISLLGYSVPVFWLGMMGIFIFSGYLPLFPVMGMFAVNKQPVSRFLNILWHTILPTFTLAASLIAMTARLTRTNMLEVMRLDFMTTAVCKGLDRKTVIYKHALRNALIPVVTILGINGGYILAGSILVESVFAWPGLGRLLYESIFSRDYPLMLGEL